MNKNDLTGINRASGAAAGFCHRQFPVFLVLVADREIFATGAGSGCRPHSERSQAN